MTRISVTCTCGAPGQHTHKRRYVGLKVGGVSYRRPSSQRTKSPGLAAVALQGTETLQSRAAPTRFQPTTNPPPSFYFYAASACHGLPCRTRCCLTGCSGITYPTISEVGNIEDVVYSQNTRGSGPIFPGRLPGGRDSRDAVTTNVPALGG